MSKAGEFAYSKYPKYKKGVLYDLARNSIMQGYHQAEEEFALTWEDIRELHIIFTEVDVEIELGKIDIKTETLGYYKEVLKRFNEERKEK